MATPKKQSRFSQNESESVVGYLHSMSPVKVSRKNSHYFEASIQTGQEEYKRLVCFSPEKRAVCVQASDNHQAVKLIDYRKAISQSDAGSFDVLVTSRTRVEAADNPPFGCRELRSSDKKTIAEILSMGPRQKVGSVDVKVLQATGSRVVPLNSEEMEVKDFAVCDPTGQTSFSAWGSQIVSVQEGRSYCFEGLATRKSSDLTELTTTPSTAISGIPVVGQPSSMAPLSANVEQTIHGQVTGVQILAKPRCRRCHTPQDTMARRSTTHRCKKCQILQLTPSYSFTYTGVLVVQQGDGTEFSGTLTNSAVFKYVRDTFLAASSHDDSVLEEHVTGQGEVEVTTNGEGLVLGFLPARSGKSALPSLGAEGGQDDSALGELLDNSEDINEENIDG